MILSEGAGAIVLARDGFVTIERAHPGGYFRKRAEAEKILKNILCDLSEVEIDLAVSSANGTFIDQAESGRFTRLFQMHWFTQANPPWAKALARRIVADHSGGPSALFERDSSGASRGSGGRITAFTLANADYERAACDRFKLRA